MAWTTKSDRFGANVPGNNTAPNLGPGTYIGHRNHDVHQNVAPFVSTAERAVASSTAGLAAASAPPIGTYDPRLPGGYESGLPKKFVAFKSSANRFKKSEGAKSIAEPGPGAYNIGPSAPATLSHRTMGLPRSEQKPMLRSFSAPSIPQNHQSFGYEEVHGGRLQRQGPKDGGQIFTGRIGDSVGPGQYAPQQGTVHRRAQGGKFLQGARSDGPGGMMTPGPGHYIEKRLNRPQKLGSSFASSVERQDAIVAQKIKAENPGPGQYACDVASKPGLRETHAEMQYFGSTVERFKRSQTTAEKNPGPGAYMQKAMRQKSLATPFNHIADRWDPNSMHNYQKMAGFMQVTPGPGAYNTQAGSGFGPGSGTGDDDGNEYSKTFSVLGNSGGLAFGAMTKRFVRHDLKADEVPGPGAYDAEEEKPGAAPEGRPASASRGKPGRGGKLKGGPGYQFKSKTPKDAELQGLAKQAQGQPPPGAYDPRPAQDAAAIVRVPGKQEGFLASSGRFGLKSQYGLQVPGPGMYNPAESKGRSFNRSMSQGAPVRGRATNLGFLGAAQRFEEKPITDSHHKTPGPGTYETQPEWNTRTYNCLFGEVI